MVFGGEVYIRKLKMTLKKKNRKIDDDFIRKLVNFINLNKNLRALALFFWYKFLFLNIINK